MNRNGGAITLEIDGETAILLAELAEWGISEQEIVRRTLEQFCTRVVGLDLPGGKSDEETAMLALVQENEQQQLEKLRQAVKSENERESLLLRLRFAGFNNDQIAQQLSEDVEVVRMDMNKLMAKLRYRLKNRRSRLKATTEPGRLEAFNELQSRLGLTSAKAAEWLDSVREARR